MSHLSTQRARRRKARSPTHRAAVGAHRRLVEQAPPWQPPSGNPSGLGFSAGSRNRAAQGARAAGVTRRLTVGITHGASHQAEMAAGRGTRRVPPPSIPNGRYGGRRGTRYRYPGSSRTVRVGGSSLTNVGLTQCVPCSEVARAARG